MICEFFSSQKPQDFNHSSRRPCKRLFGFILFTEESSNLPSLSLLNYCPLIRGAKKVDVIKVFFFFFALLVNHIFKSLPYPFISYRTACSVSSFNVITIIRYTCIPSYIAITLLSHVLLYRFRGGEKSPEILLRD